MNSRRAQLRGSGRSLLFGATDGLPVRFCYLV